MTLQERIDVLVALGQYIASAPSDLEAVIHQTALKNPWFTPDNQRQALTAIASAFLNRSDLEAFVGAYPAADRAQPLSVGLVLAGNIPLVGFHDVLCVFLAGHRAVIKVSDKDPYLLPFLVRQMAAHTPSVSDYFRLSEGAISGFDAVIATGSNNASRYFEAYFGKYPHIIRKNRNAIAVLSGQESTDDFVSLGQDIFSYFGLGCRNVSKIFVPEGYDFEPLLETLHEHYKYLVLHDKYKNNFDYNFTLVILNKVAHVSNGSLILYRSEGIASPISVVHYETYTDWRVLNGVLQAQADDIQCVVSALPLQGLPVFHFGEAQKPRLSDFADGVDTMAFLTGL